jgi:hypothetical protein
MLFLHQQRLHQASQFHMPPILPLFTSLIAGVISGDTEFILPSQFLLGNPRWHSSAAGSFQRIHPSTESDAGRQKPRSSRSRGVSLDWPGRIPGAPLPTVQAEASGNGSAAGVVEAQGDAVAAINVRSKATVGE